MSYHSWALFLAVSIVVACAADEPGKDAAKPLTDRIAAIKKDHQECEKKFYDDLRTFRDDNQKIGDLNNERRPSGDARHGPLD